MPLTKKDLWVRLRDYHFDNLVPPYMTDRVAAVFGGVDAATQAFASKVARKHGWTPRFARHAIHEYKKFVYLGVTESVRVTPSKVIDVVWHEHLLFSRPYREFCDRVLEREFDHNPELIPADDQTEVFNFQYEATLDAYEREFNITAPADVWGTTKFVREAKPSRCQWAAESTAADTRTGESDTPLHMLMHDDSSLGVHSGSASFHFGDGGAFSGGGGGSDWSGDSGDSSSGADGGSSDGGDSGGSSCSSSCGGGCSS